MKNEKPIMNEKRIIRVLLTAAAVMLLCGAFCGAAAADTVNFNPGSEKYTTASALVEKLNTPASGTAELITTVVTNDTVKLLKDVNITANHLNFNNAGDLYLDLNGHVLSRDKNATTGQSVIEIYGATNLILMDSNPNEEHKFTVNSNGLWTLNDSASSGYKVVNGGVITGGSAGEGGGILIVHTNSKLTMKAGNVVGNYATKGGGVSTFSSGGGTFTMDGGTIQGNITKNLWDGGGVNIFAGDTFNMTGGLIANNTASDKGGGVNVLGTFNMSGGSIDSNQSAGHGGGVAVRTGGSFIMSGNAKISNNITGSGSNGGGVWVEKNSIFTLTGGEISGNEAKNNGGGVYVSSYTCQFSMEESTAVIKDNKAVTGGGIMTYCGFTISGTSDGSPEISGNKATGTGDNGTGGGIYAYADEADIVITLMGGTISKNEAAGNGGGGIGIGGGSYTSTLNISGGTIKENQATSTANKKGTGGGIYIEEKGKFSMTGGTVEKNTAAGNGGGISIASKSGDTVPISGGVISENKAVTGGGIMTYRSLTLAPEAGKEIKITKNEANGNGDNGAGGGIYCWNAAVTIKDGVEISENKALGNGGGGVCIENNASLIMTGGLIKKNITQPLASHMVNYVGMGGGVRVADSTSFEFSGGTITENETIGSSDDIVLSSGGGVAILKNAKIEISGDAVISYNKSTSNGGGGLWIGNGASANCSMSGGEIAYNTTSGNGGGVDINSATNQESFEITGGKIHDNTAEHSGGGIAVLNGGTLKVEGTAEITGNTAANVGGGTGLGGGIFAWKGPEVSISDNVRITGNTANGAGGGGICIEGSTLNLTGGNITGNHTSDGSGAGIYIIDAAAENASGVLKVSGNPVVTENRNLRNAALSNIRLPASGKIILTNKLNSAAVLFVNNENRDSGFVFAQFSDDYPGTEADKNADAAKFRFDGDHSPGCVVLSDGTLKWGVLYTVSFETFDYGDPAPVAQGIHQGGYAAEPVPVISEPGFIFKGWYADDECTTKWDWGNPVNANTTIYAKWELEPPVLTFDGVDEEATSQPYDGMEHELKADHVRDDVEYIWMIDDEELNNPSLSYYLRDVSDSGLYAVSAAVSKGDYQWLSSTVTMDIKIVPRQVSIIAKDQTIILGNDIKHGVEWVETSWLGEEDELVGITLKKDESKKEITPSDAKVVRDTKDVNENYNFTYYPGALTITKRTETSSGTSIWLKDTAVPTAAPTPVPTPAAQETPTVVETPVPTETAASPFPIAAALAGLGAVAVLLLRRQ